MFYAAPVQTEAQSVYIVMYVMLHNEILRSNVTVLAGLYCNTLDVANAFRFGG